MTAAANFGNGSTDLSREAWLLTKLVGSEGSVVCVSCLWRYNVKIQCSTEAVMQMSYVRKNHHTQFSTINTDILQFQRQVKGDVWDMKLGFLLMSSSFPSENMA